MAMNMWVSYTPDSIEAAATFGQVIVLDYHRSSIHPMMSFSMIAKTFLNAFRIVSLVSTLVCFVFYFRFVLFFFFERTKNKMLIK